MKIGFDLDKVFVNYPPMVPGAVIDWLYKNHCQKTLSYRIPKNTFEKTIRRLSHFSKLRPPIKKNIDFICNFPNKSNQHTLYLVSSRFGFLEKITYQLLKRNKLMSPFTSIHLNIHNAQPHLFKERIINKLKINIFVDDDLELLKHLQAHCPRTKLLWYNPKGSHFFKTQLEDQKNNNQNMNEITAIKDLTEVTKFLKK